MQHYHNWRESVWFLTTVIPPSQHLLTEKEMTTHSSILAWRISMDRGGWRATVLGVTESDGNYQECTFIDHVLCSTHCSGHRRRSGEPRRRNFLYLWSYIQLQQIYNKISRNILDVSPCCSFDLIWKVEVVCLPQAHDSRLYSLLPENDFYIFKGV